MSFVRLGHCGVFSIEEIVVASELIRLIAMIRKILYIDAAYERCARVRQALIRLCNQNSRIRTEHAGYGCLNYRVSL